jgi:hypothetical protein
LQKVDRLSDLELRSSLLLALQYGLHFLCVATESDGSACRLLKATTALFWGRPFFHFLLGSSHEHLLHAVVSAFNLLDSHLSSLHPLSTLHQCAANWSILSRYVRLADTLCIREQKVKMQTLPGSRRGRSLARSLSTFDRLALLFGKRQNCRLCLSPFDRHLCRSSNTTNPEQFQIG